MKSKGKSNYTQTVVIKVTMKKERERLKKKYHRRPRKMVFKTGFQKVFEEEI